MLAAKSRLPFALCTQLSAGRSSTHGWPLSAPPHPSQAKPQKPNPTALQIHSLRVSSPSEVFFHAALMRPPLHPSPAAGGGFGACRLKRLDFRFQLLQPRSPGLEVRALGLGERQDTRRSSFGTQTTAGKANDSPMPGQSGANSGRVVNRAHQEGKKHLQPSCRLLRSKQQSPWQLLAS